MGCSSCSKRAGRATYLVTFPDRSQKAYSTETEAKAAIARKGGTYKKN